MLPVGNFQRTLSDSFVFCLNDHVWDLSVLDRQVCFSRRVAGLHAMPVSFLFERDDSLFDVASVYFVNKGFANVFWIVSFHAVLHV